MAELRVDGFHHLGVERGDHLGGRFDERGGNPAVDEVLGHLDADEAAAHDDRCPRLVEGTDHRVGILDGAQRERPLDARDGRLDRTRARREDERVVREFLLGPGLLRSNDDDATVAIDADRLVEDADVDPEPRGQRRRGLQQEGGPPLDDTADVVRQAAVRERDMAASLDDGDPGRLIEPAKPGRGRHPTRNPADDDDVQRAIGRDVG